MPDFLHALQSGAANLWLFIPTAILLGAMHGLEPGHSKTMMAAFIVAIRGTVWQAILLGLSAAISHSFIIWLLAAGALHYGSRWDAEHVEPYLQLGSAACIVALAAWMFIRTRREVSEAHSHSHHGHDHSHDHGHGHHHHHEHDERVIVPTGHGSAELSIFENDAPPVFRLAFIEPSHAAAAEVTLETVRANGNRLKFTFVEKDNFLESSSAVPEPHEFEAVLTFTHEGQAHTASVQFREGHAPCLAGEAAEFQDAHERAHAEDIARRFAGRTVTTPQIVLFGITGGLMPCPAAFTVLLICLQLKRATLGFAMVASFSLGLALTMVLTGVIAALSVRHAEKRFRGFGEIMRRAPYISCVLLVALATYMAWHGWTTLPAHG